MSKKRYVFCIACVAGLLLATLAISDFTSVARGQEVLPGGRPAKIRSYTAQGTTPTAVTLVEPIEGNRGFVVTDVIVTVASAPSDYHVSVYEGDPGAVNMKLDCFPGRQPVHLDSGIVFQSGEKLTAQVGAPNGTGFWVTVSGYVY